MTQFIQNIKLKATISRDIHSMENKHFFLCEYICKYYSTLSIIFRNPLAQMEEEKREHELKMKKMEAEMEQVFEMKVKEKKQKLKDSELELTRRHEERKKVRLFIVIYFLKIL